MVEELHSIKLKEVVKKAADVSEEMLICCAFLREHWARIHTSNIIEWLNWEARRCTHVVGSFSEGNSAWMLMCVQMRRVVGIP